MKRRRGAKSGYKKSKKTDQSTAREPPVAQTCVNNEGYRSMDEADDVKPKREMDAEPSPHASEKLKNVSNLNSLENDAPNEKPVMKTGHGRVKVKLRSSRALEPHRSQSDAQTASDTDKSNLQVALETVDTGVVKREDSTYSDGHTSGGQPKKAGSIKIKSSRGLGLQTEIAHETYSSKRSSPLWMLHERGLVPSDTEKVVDSLPRALHQKDPCYNEKELKAALEVIKKVMKMDAAGPFNAPVDTISLNIPDYFDIIDTPMDFGTIRHDLEHRSKYVNSADVYKDVQFIWENCYKYNNKGDYILDLMKRVKKNFMKYWTAAGLFIEPPTIESTQTEGVMQPGQEKIHHKSKSKHKRRRYGIENHKSDCLCAVCVVRRKRKEREENSVVVESQMAMSDADRVQELKLEGRSPLDNPCSEDVSSSLDHSVDTDANPDEEEVEDEGKMESPEQQDSAQPEKEELINNEMELHPNVSGSNLQSEQSPLENGTDSNHQSRDQEMELDIQTQPREDKEDTVVLHKGIATDHHHQVERRNQEEPDGRGEQIQEQEVALQENHSILQICMNLFPGDCTSVWSGRHSLFCRDAPILDGPIHAAVATFLKQ